MMREVPSPLLGRNGPREGRTTGSAKPRWARGVAAPVATIRGPFGATFEEMLCASSGGQD